MPCSITEQIGIYKSYFNILYWHWREFNDYGCNRLSMPQKYHFSTHNLHKTAYFYIPTFTTDTICPRLRQVSAPELRHSNQCLATALSR